MPQIALYFPKRIYLSCTINTYRIGKLLFGIKNLKKIFRVNLSHNNSILPGAQNFHKTH